MAITKARFLVATITKSAGNVMAITTWTPPVPAITNYGLIWREPYGVRSHGKRDCRNRHHIAARPRFARNIRRPLARPASVANAIGLNEQFSGLNEQVRRLFFLDRPVGGIFRHI